jgi:hypothetical protein
VFLFKDCRSNPLGIQQGLKYVTDAQMTGYNMESSYSASSARLNGGSGFRGLDEQSYLQIDFGKDNSTCFGEVILYLSLITWNIITIIISSIYVHTHIFILMIIIMMTRIVIIIILTTIIIIIIIIILATLRIIIIHNITTMTVSIKMMMINLSQQRKIPTLSS